MTEKQVQIIEELPETLLDMTGEMLALESFVRSQSACEGRCGRDAAELWIRRIRDYLKQHITDADHLVEYFVESTGYSI